MRETTLGASFHPWKFGLLLVLFTLCVYAPSYRSYFLLDDEALLTQNPHMQSSEGLWRIWTSAENADYWPLSYSTLWFLHQAFGDELIPYHFVNVLLHALNAWLLFWILRHLKVPGAWLAGALFALHPVQVESAAWIAEIKNTLSGLFFFLSALSFLRFDETRKSRWYWLAWISFLASLLSKSSTVVLPGVLLLLLWWKHGTIQARDWLAQVPFFVLAMTLGIVGLWFQEHRVSSEAVAWTAPFTDRIAMAGKVSWFYLSNLFFPFGLSMDYGKWPVAEKSWADFLPTISCLVMMFVFWLYRRNWGKPALLAMGSFFLLLFPVMGFVGLYAFWFSPVADRWQYLPCAAIFSLVSAMVAHWIQGRNKLWPWVAVALILGMLSWLSWQRATLFSQPEKLWADSMNKNPNSPMANNCAGVLTARKKNYEGAMVLYEKAVEGFPLFLMAKCNWAAALLALGRTKEAEGKWQEVLLVEPHHASANKALADLRLQQGNTQEAIFRYQICLARLPFWTGARNKLGVALAYERRLFEAQEQFRETVRMDPNFAEAHFNLGNALAEQRLYEDSLRSYQRALQLDPNFFEAAGSVAYVLGEMGRFEDGITAARFAIEMARRIQLPKVVESMEKMIEDFRQQKAFRGGALFPK